MIKGIITGALISTIIFLLCYQLIGYGAGSCGPGIGFVFPPLILGLFIFTSMLFIKHRSITVSFASKTILIVASVLLLVYFSLFFT